MRREDICIRELVADEVPPDCVRQILRSYSLVTFSDRRRRWWSRKRVFQITGPQHLVERAIAEIEAKQFDEWVDRQW